MELKKHLTPINLVAVVLAIVIVYLALPKSVPSGPVPTDISAFAQCLTSKGLELYTTSTCPHCANQKALFGAAVSELKLYTCDDAKDNQKCIDMGIEGVPTWVLNGQKHVGEQSFTELAAISGCSLT